MNDMVTASRVGVFREKLYAFLIHLLLSLLIFCSVFYVLFVLWYPEPFFSIDGGLHGVKLIALVDLVIGPLLTLIVYRKGKKGLAKDMSVIAVMQIICLCYGIWTLYQYRPIALVFYQGSFYSMDISKYSGQPDALDRIKEIAGKVPGYAIVELPSGFDEIRALRRSATAKGETLFAQIDLYRPLHNQLDKIKLHARDLTQYLNHRPLDKVALDHWLSKHGGKVENYTFIPVLSRFKRTLLAFNTTTGEMTGTVDILLPLNIELPYLQDPAFQ